VAALVVALLVSSWLGHSRPLGADGRRIADAAERAGLGQNALSLRAAIVALGLTILASVGCALRAGAPTLWFALLPLGVAASATATGLGVARWSTRAAARLLGETARDASATLLGRAALVATLIPEAVSGLLVLGTFAWGERLLGAKVGLQLAFVAAATVAILGVVFARSTAAFVLCVDVTDRAELVAPHPGSLARVVAATFSRSILSTAALMTTSCLGHALLLAHGVTLSGEASPSSLLYPHLLRSLGLLALVFGGLVVRSSEREPLRWAWIRGAVVSSILLVAGAWSLAPSLEDAAWTRLLPGGASFVFLAALSSAALISLSKSSISNDSFSPTQLAWGAVLGLLGLSSWGLLRVAASPTPLPEHLGHSLFLACILSLLPLVHIWRVARETAVGARLAFGLSGGTDASVRGHDASPPAAWANVYWLLVLLVGYEATQLLEGEHSQNALLGFGVLLGFVTLGVSLSSSARACRRARAEVNAHLEAHVSGSPSASAAAFGDVLALARNSSGRGFVAPLFLVIAGSALWVGIAQRSHDSALSTALLGFVLGSLSSGAILGWLLEDREPSLLRGHAALALPLGLSLVTWITTGLQFF